MAFDLYIGEKRAFIDHHEEDIFSFIEENEQFPMLNWIWENFYNSPVISHEIANEILHELIRLREEIRGNDQWKHLIHVIDRLLPFFSLSYIEKTQIKCASD